MAGRVRRRPIGRLLLSVALGCAGFGSSARAQPDSASGDECFPNCRPGYVCHRARCISECNPSCDAGEVCRPGGQCVASDGARIRRPHPSLRDPDEEGELILRLDLADALFSTMGVALGAGRRLIRRFDRGAERHDGVMLRVTAGMGGSVESIDSGASERRMSGLSAMFSVDLGGALNDQVSLHGRFASAALSDPDYEVDGVDRGELSGLRANAFLLAPAVTYYLMPANVYLTGAAGLSWINLDDAQEERRWSESGLGFNLDLGKEWWVSRNWGMGVAGRFWFSYFDYRDEGRRFEETFTGLAVLFSATYQ
jgi:hypothetical protein